MLTKLDIINAMLATTSTAPLTSTNTQHPMYKKAEARLDAVQKHVQAKGWWFNRAERTLNPDTDGHIVLPSVALSVDPVDRRKNYVVRGNRLYNLDTGSFVIGAAVKVWYVDLVAVEDLPTTAAQYISARASYEFYRDADGAEPKLSQYIRARDEAWIDFKGQNLKHADVNWFDSVSHAQMSRGYRGNRLPLSDEQE